MREYICDWPRFQHRRHSGILFSTPRLSKKGSGRCRVGHRTLAISHDYMAAFS